MSYTTILSPAELAPHLADPAWVIVDCRFSLADAAAGRSRYLQSHIPGAVYADLNRQLSAAAIPGVTGRHPLPTPKAAARTLGDLGIGPGVQVVAYDDMGGALAAARLWWMLRWLGHTAAAVLDGGWQRWCQEGHPVRPGEELRPRREFIPQVRPGLVVDAAEVETLRQDARFRLMDARSAERYHGQNETIDPVAGHIPGASSAPYSENLTPEGLFRSPAELQARYRALLGNVPAENAVVYCGSGVTAAHNVLALAHAGMGEAQLYAGSWSDWITDPARPKEETNQAES